ncbi:MAG: dTDP-3-amino-3,6-dideoxy-alpha-D-galactopyranose transaminase [Lentisphaerae bacterium ADurb.Bin242]|nr:MAG: dTDP-3-amino-3,6-dideoxy-alpha-D-galactopyranose transaminase [Lentisphaerae bacterium ADurb.Bin242]
MKTEKLAVNGGPKAVNFPLKSRFHFGAEEKAAADALFDESIRTGNAFGYNGPEEEAFGKEFAQFLGGGFADGVNSGTNAVFVALRALELPPFSEVVVGPVTDPGGIMPIVMLNCIPVTADAAPGSFNTGAAQIEEVITPETRAIVVPHIGGEPADMREIMKVADKHSLAVVEDCAQSHAATIDGQFVGTFGTYGAFSLMFGKHFCTGGQGGAVFSKTEELYWRERRAADRGKPFGLNNVHGNVIPALNCNLDELGAAIGRAQLKKLPEIVGARRRFAAMLKERGMDRLHAVSIPEVIPGAQHSYWWWRLRFHPEKSSASKADYCAALAAEGLIINPDYSFAVPTSLDWYREHANKHPWNNPCYKGDRSRSFQLPNVHQSMDTHFILFILESWGGKEADAIMEAFRKVDSAYAV